MNPCTSCGACCASFRISFPADESDHQSGGQVPAALVEDYGHACVMRTATQGGRRCIALRGEIGQAVSCAIYTSRPSSCRDFAPLAQIGRGDEACNEARRRHGLPPLGD